MEFEMNTVDAPNAHDDDNNNNDVMVVAGGHPAIPVPDGSGLAVEAVGWWWWWKRALAAAYADIFLLAFATFLESEGQTTYSDSVKVFATSSFGLATVYFDQGAVQALVEPLIARLAHICSRGKALSFCVVVYMLGNLLGAWARARMFPSAQKCLAAATAGLQMLTLVLVADTSDMRDRAKQLVSRLPKRTPAENNNGPIAVLTKTWHRLDAGATLSFGLSLALALAPLSLAETTPSGWQSPRIIALLVAFPFWERSGKPLVPPELPRSRTFCVGCCVGFLYCLAFHLSAQPYFHSYLVVMQPQSPTAAGYITQAFSFASAAFSVAVACAFRHSRNYKIFVAEGAVVYLVGIRNAICNSDDDAGMTALVMNQVTAGAGAGTLTVAALLGARAAVAREHVAAATAAFFMFVELGGAVGAAIFVAVWTRLLPAKLSAYLPVDVTEAHARAIFADVAVAGNYTLYPPGSPARAAINKSYQETMQVLFTVAVLVCAPLPLLALFMKKCKLGANVRDEGDGQGQGRGQGRDQEEVNGSGRDASEDQRKANEVGETRVRWRGETITIRWTTS
ncbi:putative siderochrome-iron transporter [Nemania sp. NC0429]|nr:putative siderochrome-iron transporter [Nemania sp. NC0429]